jgi:hypothetical protein
MINNVTWCDSETTSETDRIGQDREAVKEVSNVH